MSNRLAFTSGLLINDNLRMIELSIKTPWVNQWKPDFIGTLIFVVAGSKVLLIRKKRGHGIGKVNGPGGKLEDGETLKTCAIRELFEETGLVVKDAQCRAELRFVEQKGPQWLGFVYIAEADACSDTIHQTAEADPFWSEIDQIPYHQMWPDDEIWLPAVLAKRDDSHILVYDFLLRGDELIDHQLQRNKTSSLMVD